MSAPAVTHLEAWRFHVASSEPDADPYLVDLDYYDGNGKCTCPNFEMRLEPKLAAGNADTFRQCKHIRAAMDAALPPERLRDLALTTLIRAGVYRLAIAAGSPPELPEPRPPLVQEGER
jgi:hypothetical protein